MATAIIGLISAVIGGFFALIGTIYTAKKQGEALNAELLVKLQRYEDRQEELIKRVDKHNSVIERTYALEQKCAIFDEKITVANHRIDDLESEVNK